MPAPYAYRFEYADKSAFVIEQDGRAFIEYTNGRREEKFGKIDNRIPMLIGLVAKPRQDEIDRLRAALEEVAFAADLDDARRAASAALNQQLTDRKEA